MHFRWRQAVRAASSYSSCLGCLWLVVFFVGCDSGPNLAPVRGTISVDGMPLKDGHVMFYPKKGRPAAAKIKPDGTYVLKTYNPGDGAIVGDYRVTVTAHQIENAPPAPASFAEEVAQEHVGIPQRRVKVTQLVPDSYGDVTTTPLTAQVEDRENQIDFEITP